MSIERIKVVSNNILNRLPAVRNKGEEATKQAMVLPMLDALGYDIWNPSEVCPEYDADFAIKKAGQKERVDTAILLSNTPRIYIEIKSVDESLDGHEGQLARYFNATPAVTLGILTNGMEWRFFTDTGDPNVMDSQPFHVAKVDASDQGLEVLARFSKAVFCSETIRDYATELLYTAKMANFLRQELDLKDKDLSEYFIRWILKSEGMYDGVVNANVVERFKPIAKAGLTRVIREIVRRSITAMEKEAAQGEANIPSASMSAGIIAGAITDDEKAHHEKDQGNGALENGDAGKPVINITEQELEIFAILKEQLERSALANATIHDASQRKEVPLALSYKGTTGYFGIYFNKPSWWIMRAVTETKKKWVGFNIDEKTGISCIPEGMIKLEPSPWAEFRIAINQPDDIHKLHRLVFAAFQKTIQDRMRHKGTESGEGKQSDLAE